MNQNNYLIDYTNKTFHVELVFPSYKSLNPSYYWDLGISLSVDKSISLHLNLLFGWFRFTWYRHD